MKKVVTVKFSPWADEDYKSLQHAVSQDIGEGLQNSENIQLLKAVNRSLDNLKLDPQIGIHIPRKYIPLKLAEKYGTTHLWKVNLPSYWRMMYSLEGKDIEILALVLEIVDHDEYNKLFGYRKR